MLIFILLVSGIILISFSDLLPIEDPDIHYLSSSVLDLLGFALIMSSLCLLFIAEKVTATPMPL